MSLEGSGGRPHLSRLLPDSGLHLRGGTWVQPNQPRDAGRLRRRRLLAGTEPWQNASSECLKARPRLFVTGLSALEKSGPDTGPLVEDNNEERSDHAIMPARLSLRWSNEGRQLTLFSCRENEATEDHELCGAGRRKTSTQSR